MHERTVRGDGVDLHVVERGDPAQPTVLLVHGYPDTHAVWDLVAAELEPELHVVAYDVRGAGASSRPGGVEPYRLAHLLADLAAVIEATSGGRPVHLVGHDWGSIQTWHAVTAPSLAGQLASATSMSGPSLDHVGRWFRAAWADGPPGWRRAVRQGTRSWYVLAFQLPKLPELGWRRAVAGRFAAQLEAREGVAPDDRWPAPTLAEDGACGVNLYRANVLGRLARPVTQPASVPVQLIEATGDPFVTGELLDGLEDLAPDLTRRAVDGGHWVIRSQPALVAELVAGHVREAEARQP